MSTILVSGAGGFLGKELVRQLLANGHHVIALTSNTEKLRNNFKNETELTILHTNEWTEKVDSRIDICINCAFPRSSKPDDLAEGLDFTNSFMQDVIQAGISNIINISSQSVYSQKEKAETDETAPAAPESLYGMAKYASEKIVTAIAETAKANINYSNIRLASLTGTELEVRMTNRFVKQALAGEPITINGGTQKISYLDVRDAAAALLAMVETNPEAWNHTYNLGNEHYSTVLEIAEAVKKTAKEYGIQEVDVQVNPGSADFNNLINSERFYNDFHWQPHYTIPLMVEDLFKFYTTKD